VRVLSWPVRPKAAFAITPRAYPQAAVCTSPSPDSRM
jgi:hypothetical protein